jgi:thiamine biosynthesis lipoprotein
MSLVAYTHANEFHKFSFKCMGTDFKILIDHDCENNSSTAARAAFQEANRLNLIFSDYDSESELSQLSNSSYSSQKIKLSEELFEVLEFSKSLAVETEGAFDPTLGQLSRLWRISRFRKSLPSVISIKKAMDRVGSQYLILSNQQKEATILKPGIILDLGGIAKGYTADRMMLILKNMGFDRCLIDAGGDLTLGKRPRQSKGWKIQIGGIKHPDLPTMTLENCSVATSGDSSQFVEINGTKYSHILNPRSGYGLENLTQVTVIAKNGISADSLATTFSVLGHKKSKELGLLRKKGGIRAFFVSQKNDNQILDEIQ